MKRIVIVALFVVALIISVGVIVGQRIPLVPQADTNQISADSKSRQLKTGVSVQKTEGKDDGRDGKAIDKDSVGNENADEKEEELLNEVQRDETEAEKQIMAFDNLTDKWVHPSPNCPTLSDVNDFVKSFRLIPKSYRNECIHRALNLIPDENIMLLTGVLMDKTMDVEIVETVYNDILNRSNEVKKPILREIFRDKKHPCWADTAWILDVTGELPRKK